MPNDINTAVSVVEPSSLQPPMCAETIADEALRTCSKNRLSISLRVLFLMTFIGACFSRWLAAYGAGLSVAFGWATLIGSIIGSVIGILSCMAILVRQRMEGGLVCDLREIVAGQIAGAIAAFCGAAVGFALWRALSAEGTLHVTANGIWVVAFIDHRQRPPFSSDASSALRLIVLSSSILASLSNSIAWLFRGRRFTPVLYVTTVGSLNALLLGPLPVIVLVIAMSRLPAPRSPLEYEWFGLWPLAAVLYFFIFAAIGGATGTLAAGYRLWASYAQSSRTAWFVFWLSVVYAIAFVSQAGMPA